MKCPKCHSEVGNQPVCPYCGGTMYIQNTTWNMQAHQRGTTIPVNEIYVAGRRNISDYEVQTRLHNLNMKINLALILLGGNLMLILLLLAVVMLK